MAQYPYIMKTGSLRRFLEKIALVGVPDKVTQKFLLTLDFKSTNDRAIITILKFLKLIDPSGIPTDRYRQYRDKSRSAAILGVSIRDAYSDLFKVYPNADSQDVQTLQNFFSTQTGLGQRAVRSSVDTFKALCALADFTDQPVAETLNTATPGILLPKTTPPESGGHSISMTLSEGRAATMILPNKLTKQEVERLKKMLDALL